MADPARELLDALLPHLLPGSALTYTPDRRRALRLIREAFEEERVLAGCSQCIARMIEMQERLNELENRK